MSTKTETRTELESFIEGMAHGHDDAYSAIGRWEEHLPPKLREQLKPYWPALTADLQRRIDADRDART